MNKTKLPFLQSYFWNPSPLTDIIQGIFFALSFIQHFALLTNNMFRAPCRDITQRGNESLTPCHTVTPSHLLLYFNSPQVIFI